ncbi:uncharacterized protein LOC126979402 [Leptidea sinapis]|uniref:uncharacterized protein LOC126979402 n=1 Tax=Leptidea sinapis TaxID=189913 RepID=UPI0021C2BDBB|nr:uncharacterized protein LOC126979402 [Leptidea sinapis]
MTDTLGFSEHDKKTSDLDSAGRELEKAISEVHFNENHDLHVLQKSEEPTERPILKATLYDKLRYFRCYTSSPARVQFYCLKHKHFQTFVFFHIINVIFKSIPSVYVYMFYSQYSANNQFFISKMMPIAHGSTFFFITTAVLELIIVIHRTAMYLDYFLLGIILKSPWNRCDSFKTILTISNKTMRCYQMAEFTAMFSNKTITFSSRGYISESGEVFQLSQIYYFILRESIMLKCDNIFCGLFVLLWIFAALSYKVFYKEVLWKVLRGAHFLLNCILVATFVHLSIVHFDRGFKIYTGYYPSFADYDIADTDFLSDSMTAPPIVQVLTSRSSNEVKPVLDSGVMVLSNTVYYLFRGFVTHLLKLYCEDLAKAALLDGFLGPVSFFYMWPIYFSQFMFGHFYAVMFFCLSFMVEYTVAIITFQCLIEAIVSEWRWLRHWMVCVGLMFGGALMYWLTPLIYIESQAPRNLSRYGIEKSEYNAYKLNLCYEILSSVSREKHRKSL